MILPRGELHMLGGASGSGKTTLILQALQAWERGEEFPIQFNATSCGYLVADRAERDVKELAGFLALKKVEIYGFVGDSSFPLSIIRNPDILLIKCMERLRGKHDLLILDPLLPFLLERNLKSLTSTMLSLIPLSRMAQQKGLTILGAHHTVKARTDFAFMRPQDRLSGSAGLQAYSCVQIALVEEAERGKQGHLLEITPHREPRQSFLLERNDLGWFEIVDSKEARLGRLRKAFKDSSKVSTADLVNYAEAIGISKATLFRDLNLMIDEGVISKPKHGVYAISQ